MILSNAIVVDFDGFIVEHSFPEIGELRDGAREFLCNLRDAGYKIIIASCRNNSDVNQNDSIHLANLVDFMKDNDLPYDWIDDGKSGKALGRAYCDDRNVPFYSDPNSREGFRKMLKYIKIKFPVETDFKRKI